MSSGRSRNIIMMVVDCLRADHLSCYGYEGNATPNIDKLAAAGCMYRNAYSMGSNTPASYPHILSEYLLLNLRRRGYASVLIHSNINLALARLPLMEIDLYRKDWGKGHSVGHRSRLRRLFSLFTEGVFDPYRRADLVNRAALRTMEELREPFFLCLWYMDVHMPYIPPRGRSPLEALRVFMINRRLRKAALSRDYSKIRKDDPAELMKLYDGEISYFDAHLGDFIDRISDLDDTCLILTADHGEEFMEAGDLGHQNKDIPSLRHIPFIIQHPGMSPRVVDEPFYMSDLDRTILDLAAD